MFEFSVQAETEVGRGQFSPSRMFATPESGELQIVVKQSSVYANYLEFLRINGPSIS